MASTNYTGRSVDLLIFQGTKPQGETAIHTGFDDDGGEITTGIQKLIQTWTILFLTEKGSIPSFPERGTEFVTAVRQGRMRGEDDVQAEFTLAATSIKELLDLEAETVSFPEDELLDEAILESVNISEVSSKITLSVKIVSVAGTSRVIYVPITVAIH